MSESGYYIYLYDTLCMIHCVLHLCHTSDGIFVSFEFSEGFVQSFDILKVSCHCHSTGGCGWSLVDESVR